MKIEIEQAYNGYIVNIPPQDMFWINNSKHNSIGYIKELCTEYLRLEFQDQMKKSLDNPKNNTCDWFFFVIIFLLLLFMDS